MSFWRVSAGRVLAATTAAVSISRGSEGRLRPPSNRTAGHESRGPARVRRPVTSRPARVIAAAPSGYTLTHASGLEETRALRHGPIGGASVLLGRTHAADAASAELARWPTVCSHSLLQRSPTSSVFGVRGAFRGGERAIGWNFAEPFRTKDLVRGLHNFQIWVLRAGAIHSGKPVVQLRHNALE